MTAFVCGPDRPTVAIIDFAAPMPSGQELTVAADGLLAQHTCEEPLERFRVRLEATGSPTRMPRICSLAPPATGCPSP